MRIEAPPVFRKTANQAAPYSALGIKEASDVTVRNFVYVPLLVSVDATARYNQPFVCWGSCVNVKADVKIRWPKNVALPTAGHPATKSGIQLDKPGSNNSVTSATGDLLRPFVNASAYRCAFF